jgi:hypothetical protein
MADLVIDDVMRCTLCVMRRTGCRVSAKRITQNASRKTQNSAGIVLGLPDQLQDLLNRQVLSFCYQLFGPLASDHLDGGP